VLGVALVLVAGLLSATAVVALSAPAPLINYSPPVPSVSCAPGVSPAQSFCYVGGGSHGPDTNVPPPSLRGSAAP